MKTNRKVNNLTKSINLFTDKSRSAKVKYYSLNGELHPILSKQLESIINQVKDMEESNEWGEINAQ